MAKLRDSQLRARQDLPLDIKIRMFVNRVKWFCDNLPLERKVAISFSGGLDSTVMLFLIRKHVSDQFPAVYFDTGVEFPEMRQFVKTFKNVEIIKPKSSYKEIVKDVGFPVISKLAARFISDLQNASAANKKTQKLRLEGINSKGEKSSGMRLSPRWRFMINAPFKVSNRCCDILKHGPAKKYKAAAIIGTMAEDSQPRRSDYLQNGCNIFNQGEELCRPLSFFTRRDLLDIIDLYKITICEIYEHYEHTGCISCGFGAQYDISNLGLTRYQKLHQTHPKLWDIHINQFGIGDRLQWINENAPRLKSGKPSVYIPFEKEVKAIEPVEQLVLGF
jgi:3'-phosphoadenosine 5'-phosphosulfate sulfotransferase (PAPS reductase)/FAD synthetase